MQKKAGSAGPEAPKELPITLRAMLAADVSATLPTRLKHFVHVLALHATNSTGRGLSGQATLAHYMGVTKRHVTRLWAELDASWNAGTCPVAAHREARFHSSDAYQLEVRADAPLQLERTIKRGKATIAQDEVLSKAGQGDEKVQSIGSGSPTIYTESLGAPTQSDSTESVAVGGPVGGRTAPIGDDLPYDPTPDEARAFLAGANGERTEYFARRARLGEVAARRWPEVWEGRDIPGLSPGRLGTRRHGLVRCVLGEIPPPR